MGEQLDLRHRALELHDVAIERLERLVMAESPSGDRHRIATVVDDLEAGYQGADARVVRMLGADGDHLVCHWPAEVTDATGHVLLIGHCDTALPAGTTAVRPFRVDGDTMTGPGVYDMKGALVQVQLAIRLIAESGRRLRRPVRLVIVNDEEIGSPDGRRVVAAHVSGAVAAIGLEPPLPRGAIKIGRRGVARVMVSATGREAHSGLDAALGVSAIEELVDQLTTLRGEFARLDEATMNIGTLSGGTRANVVAGEAHAEIGLRFATPDAESAAFAALRSLRPRRAHANVHVESLSHRPVWPPDPSNPLAKELVDLGAELGIVIGTGVAGGAGDTNHVGISGIPTVDGLGPEGAGAHGPAERASVNSLLTRTALLAAYLSQH